MCIVNVSLRMRNVFLQIRTYEIDMPTLTQVMVLAMYTDVDEIIGTLFSISRFLIFYVYI
jgi:hypothetical protein